MYTMGSPILIVSISIGKSIRIHRVNNNKLQKNCSIILFQLQGIYNC